MSTITAFQPMGKTFVLVGNSTNQTVTVSADSPVSQYLFVNHELAATGQPVYFVISANSSVTCTLPANGSPQYALVSVPASTKVYTVPYQISSTPIYIAFIGEAASEAYFTPGEGF